MRSICWATAAPRRSGQRVHGGPQGGRLLEDVHAVLLPLDHPGDPADLALHSTEPVQQQP